MTIQYSLSIFAKTTWISIHSKAELFLMGLIDKFIEIGIIHTWTKKRENNPVELAGLSSQRDICQTKGD